MSQVIRSELERKGYTKDVVIVHCANPRCKHKAVCKWSRNMERGINFGRPLIELPEDWKTVLTYGTSKQDVLCPTCHPEDLPEGSLLR